MKKTFLKRAQEAACRNLTAMGICLLLAAVYCLIFSWYSTPLLPKTVGYDASFFRLVGEGMTKGYLPFRDFFDQKGPYLYFIEYLAQIIWPGRIGIFILEILSIGASCFLAYKTASLFIRHTLLRYGCVVIMLGTVAVFFGGGNLVSEWCLPLSMLCVYLFARHYTADLEAPHPAKYAFWYGLCFTAIAFVRIIDAALICAVVFSALVLLLKNKQFKVLLQNMGMFLLGCAAAAVPVLVWAAVNGILQDMFYQVFVFGFLYAADNTASFRPALLLLLVPVIYLIFSFKKMPLVFKLFYISGTISSGIAVNVGGGYIHYSIIMMPLLVLSVIEIAAVLESGRFDRKKGLLLISVLLVFMTQGESLVRCVYDTYKVQVQHVFDRDYDNAVDILSYIPENERNNVLSFDASFIPYIAGEFFPCNRYCGWQSHYIELQPSIADEMVEAMSETPVLWMITSADRTVEDEKIAACLKSDYELFAQNETYSLYRYIA